MITFVTNYLRTVKKCVMRRAPLAESRLAYQEKLAPSLEARISMIMDALPSETRSILDIGCNLGDISAGLAQKGYWVLGIDADHDLIKKAQSRHDGIPNCGFMVSHVDADAISAMPDCDCSLVFSVVHHWIMEFGPVVAGGMLRTLTQKTKKVVLFEGASRRQRYGDYPPDFIDNDERTVTTYLANFLNEYCGDVISRCEPLGPIACVGDREPWRWNFAMYR